MMKAIETLVHSTTSRRVGNHAVMVGDEYITLGYQIVEEDV